MNGRRPWVGGGSAKHSRNECLLEILDMEMGEAFCWNMRQWSSGPLLGLNVAAAPPFNV